MGEVMTEANEAAPTSDDDGVFLPVEDEDLDKELFEKNMNTFRMYQPALAVDLEMVSEPHSRLISDGEGGFDIEFRGARLYGKAADKWAEDRLDDLKAGPGLKRLILSAPDSRNLDTDANTTVHRIVKRSIEAGMEFSRQPIDLHCYHLVIMGVGLGTHVEDMMRKTDCQHVLLVEPNIEFLYWSMFVFDWGELYGRFVAERRKMSFVPYQTFGEIAECVRDRMRYISPSFMDSTFFLLSYPSSVMEAALGKLFEQKDLFITGLGFLEDEIDMVRNSYNNLKGFEGKHYTCFDKTEVRSLPAFIIGAGPSVDNDLEFLRENQGNAIIISCGTAIRVLLSNGIKPDFQMEIENVPAVTELTEIVAKKFDLSGITLVASSTVDPGAQTFYDRTVFYFRSSLASYPMFYQGPETTIQYSTPNIANLGFSFAQEIGCRSIYFFGADLGARDPNKHHADDSAYNVGEVGFNTTIDKPTPANFGGVVQSEMLYLWSKASLEEAINRFPANRIYYNCSDGVRIRGTVPKLSSTIELPDVADKSVEVEAIIDRFPDYLPKFFEKSWTVRDPITRVKRFRDLLLSRCGEPPVDPEIAYEKSDDGYDIKPAEDPDLPAGYTEPSNEDGALEDENKWTSIFPFNYLCEITRDFIPSGGLATSEMHYYRGSTFMSMAAIYFYYQRVINGGENREDFIKIVNEEFIDQTKRIADVILDFYGTLETSGKKKKKKSPAKKKPAAKKTARKSPAKKSAKKPATKKSAKKPATKAKKSTKSTKSTPKKRRSSASGKNKSTTSKTAS